MRVCYNMGLTGAAVAASVAAHYNHNTTEVPMWLVYATIAVGILLILLIINDTKK